MKLMFQRATDLKSRTQMNEVYITYLMFIAFVKVNVIPFVLLLFCFFVTYFKGLKIALRLMFVTFQQ